MNNPRKAVALISGGLDSMLAAKVIQAQGIHVEGINFYTGFCHTGHTSAVRSTKPGKVKRNDALWVAEQLNMKLHIIDAVEAYKKVLTEPKYGYGKHVNPCLDCKIFMVQSAYKWIKEHDFDFIITGEVMGQRPHSQLKKKLPIVAKASGAEDRLLRPLCAQRLEPTLPERMGWVDRDKLHDYSGRGRKPQLALAESFNIDEFAQPSGGCCVLTDKSYASKLQDMWRHQGNKQYSLDDIILLKIGRHLRPRAHYKLVVGREEGENQFLQGYGRRFTQIKPVQGGGALALVDGQPTADDIRFASRVVARFSQSRDADSVMMEVNYRRLYQSYLTVKPLPVEQINPDWYV